MKWKKIIQSISPILGSAIGGPFGAMATKIITDSLGIPQSSNDEKINEAIQKSPDSFIKIKEAELKLKATLKEFNIKEKELEYKDKNSARNRDIKTKDNVNKILGSSVVIGWAAINFILLFNGIDDNLPEPVLYRILGTLDAALMAVLYYYFGSSSRENIKK